MDRVSQAQSLVALLAEQLCSSIGVVHQQSYSHEVAAVPNTVAVFARSIADTVRATETVLACLPSMAAEATADTDTAISEAQRLGDESSNQLRFKFVVMILYYKKFIYNI